jgi:hypothetical protein
MARLKEWQTAMPARSLSPLQKKEGEPKVRISNEAARKSGKLGWQILLFHHSSIHYRANFGRESSEKAEIFRATMRVAPQSAANKGEPRADDAGRPW